jgi:hypothetical protein
LGINLRLNTRVDAATLTAEGFDEVIVATGIEPRRPQLEGIDHPKVVNYIDVIMGRAEVGQKVAIVSPKAQTTRTRLMGVALTGVTQIVLVDTPGIFDANRRFDRAMVQAAWGGAADADIIALVIDAKGDPIFCEGYATGLSIRAAMKAMNIRYKIYICFSASNVMHMASGIPGGLVVADNDPNGIGEKAARESGKPFWLSDTAGEDFNDFHVRVGLFRASQSLKEAYVASSSAV